MTITIAPSIKEKWPQTALGVIEARVEYAPENSALKTEMQQLEKELAATLQLEEIAALPAIADTRAAYRAFGKEPARYRVSSEALIRRIVQKKGLYYINNIVDTNNLVSIRTQHALCCFDKAKIEGNIAFQIAGAGESYQGIGKGNLNIEFLPVFADTQGSFGSPTSDSQRTMITPQTEEIFFIIVSFSGATQLQQHLDDATLQLTRYCNATIHGQYIVT